ncbi:MAG: TonB family protein [Brevundimonas sp.]|nr:MAG: TonB family protein [Brevundimonas sp.]
MIAFAFAAALLLDATPKPKADLVPVKSAAGQTTPTSGVTLQNVAVTLECTARASGRVEGCRVLGETHPGLGFGEAAIALMRDAEVAPGPRDIQFARTIQFMP